MKRKRLLPLWVKVYRLVTPYPTLDRFCHCLELRQVKWYTLFRTARPKKHTLFSGTSRIAQIREYPLNKPVDCVSITCAFCTKPRKLLTHLNLQTRRIYSAKAQILLYYIITLKKKRNQPSMAIFFFM